MSTATGTRLRPFKPTRFGRYTLLMPISTGGMGEVFLARLEGAQGFEKLCVIKKILPHLAEDHDFVERFVDEARILVKLSHGAIAQVLDMGVEDGAPYIALEHIDGKDLRRVAARMRDRKMPLPLSFVLFVMTRVLDALAYAHRKRGDDDKELNLVHRDVSPQNILISYEGEVKMIDFGLAKSTLSSSKTNPSIILGKFLYMSPEQARHQKVDRRSDLYAVGLCLYELVAGKNPFDEVPPGELMAQVASPKLRPLTQAEPLCPAALGEAVTRALSPDPAQRFQTAEEFRARLQAILHEIDPAAGSEKASRFMREAFAVEYHAERKMLSALREQAKQIPLEDDVRPSRAEGLRALKPEPTAPAALSFHPTKKTTGSGGPDFERETLPGIVIQVPVPVPAPAAAATLPLPPPEKGERGDKQEKRTLPKSRDFEPTDSLGVALPPVGDEPSVLVDDGLSKENPGKPLLPPPPTDRLKTMQEVPIAEAPGPKPSGPRKPVPPKGEPAPRKSGLRAAVPRPPPSPKNEARAGEPKPAPKAEVDTVPLPAEKPDAAGRAAAATVDLAGDTPAMELPIVQGQAEAPMATPPKKSTGWLIWLVLPLLAVLAVAGYIAWDVYAESLRQERLEDEQRREVHQDTEAQPEEPRKSREVKVPGTGAPEEPDDLAGLPTPVKDAKAPKEPVKAPKVTGPPRVAAAQTPGEAALRTLKGNLGRLKNASAAGRFKIQLNAFDNDVKTKGNDPAWVKKVEAVNAAILVELEKPENQ